MSLYYIIQKLIYATGRRPSFMSYWYNHRLEAQEQWRTGKK